MRRGTAYTSTIIRSTTSTLGPSSCSRPRRGALGPNETFAALWQRRVQSLLVDPDATRPRFRCSVCCLLNVCSGPCAECAGKATEVGDAYEEAVKDAIEQSAQVRYWKDPALPKADSIAALTRF